MLCLNIRQTYPRIGLHSQLSSLETKSPEADLHTTYESPTAGVWPKAAEVNINQYPSRHSYGYSNLKDLGAENAKQGFDGVEKGINRRVQEGNDMLNNGTKHNVVAAEAKAQLVPTKDRVLVVERVTPPEITVTPSYMQGNIDTGRDEVTIQPHEVQTHYTPGSLDIFLQDPGSIRMWTTEGRYDIYA